MIEKAVISKIESEIKRACKFGHFMSFQSMKNRRGIEIILPNTIDQTQAIVISKYFENKYGVQSCFFIKKHAINVYYED